MKHHFLFRCLPLLLLAALLLCACSGGESNGDAPDGCVRLENDAVDYTFCYDETWEVDRNDGMVGIKRNVAGGSSIAYASISVMSFTLSSKDKGMGANNYWDDYRADLEELYGDRIAFESEKAECKLGGIPANRNLYTLSPSADETYTYEQIVCVRGGVVYLVTLTSPEGGYESAVDCLNTVIETFQFK